MYTSINEQMLYAIKLIRKLPFPLTVACSAFAA